MTSLMILSVIPLVYQELSMSENHNTQFRLSTWLCTTLLFMAQLCFCPQLFAHSIEVSEDIMVTVQDGITGEPLIAVSVFTEDQKFVAFTDINGQVPIPVLSHRQEVYFSYVGYSELKVPYFELRKNNTVKLFASTNLVDSIVVVGRRDDPVKEIPFKVDRITREEIAFKNA